jgi:hypothetical protein
MRKKSSFPMKVTEEGVSAIIRRTVKIKNGTPYPAYIVDYSLLGQPKQEWRADFKEAKQAARDACKKIAKGEHLALQLKNGERMTYLRATEALASVNVPLGHRLPGIRGDGQTAQRQGVSGRSGAVLHEDGRHPTALC